MTVVVAAVVVVVVVAAVVVVEGNAWRSFKEESRGDSIAMKRE